MKALVTGGGGFLGRYVVEELLRAGHEVTALGRNRYPAVEALGARGVQVDLCDAAAVRAAVAGHDTVLHVAAKSGVWGPAQEYERANVLATRNVLAACAAAGVRRLVHTSSPSVVFDGRDHVDVAGPLPYPARYLCHYPRTKALAEREVLAANGRGGLATCALRPHLIVGPRDPHLVPRILARARAGRLVVVGRGDNRVSLTFAPNAARAHVAAAERLAPDAPHAGKAYFIAQREPVRLWEWIAELCARLDIPGPRGRMSARAAYAAGACLEAAWSALPLPGEPPMTRFVALQLSTTHTYDLAPARRDFGYEERVPMSEAFERLVADLRGSQALHV